ncbi:MAG: alpha/beta hydrolase [Leptospirales bacterium]|nr:alpha/beta hydrolase [Leptospirales bacterium]
MDAASWKDAGKYFKHKGHSIFYRIDGAGPALLLLHGFPTSSWDFDLVWGDLAARSLLVAPDFIGYGYSDKPHEYEYSILDQADLVEGLLAELRIAEVRILAHDYGVSVAQELLARFRDRKRDRKKGLELISVCFLNGGLFPESHKPRLIQKLLLSPLGRFVSLFLNEGSFSRAFSEIFGPQTRPKPEDLEQFWQLIQYNKGKEIYYKLIGYLPEREKYRERWVNAMMNSRIPLRLINGPEDPVSGLHMAETYKKLIQHPDVVLLPGIGHYPQVEDPASVVKAYFEFVDHKQEED